VRERDPRYLPVTIIDACQRNGRGGSPTAVLDDADLPDDERARLPELLGTSHVVFVGMPETPDDPVSLRFFTSAGELPACGHGTVAALAYLASRAGARAVQTTLSAGGRIFEGQATRVGDGFLASFDPGPVTLRPATDDEVRRVLAAIGVGGEQLGGTPYVASVGRERMLVPVVSVEALAGLSPDFGQLRRACDHSGLLGSFVYCVPSASGRGSARMFAPSIGVDEDIANANSTACLAAYLTSLGLGHLSIDMGDAVGVPATIVATTTPVTGGFRVDVGGHAAPGSYQPR
jgi:trans-2,3-dihydro-3-hydroxyanthranilate isomerase